MHRKPAKISRRTRVLVALGALGAFLTVVLGFGLSASATSTPITGAQPNGSVAVCVNSKTYVWQAAGTWACASGYTRLTVKPAVTVVTPPSYVVGTVQISRGGATPATWATYSTSLDTPEGGITGGTFRATCSDAQAPCKISLAARASVPGLKVYPRMDIMRQDLNGGPETYCEYADGADNNGAAKTLTSVAQVVPLGIGGSLDCAGGQTYPTDGIASEIWVPAGHYDITTTLAATS